MRIKVLSGKVVVAGLLAFFLFQSQVSAADDPSDGITMAGMQISKDDILKSLESLRKEKKISEDEYQRAKADLLKMNQKEVDGISSKAADMVVKDPAAATKLLDNKKVEEKKKP